MNDAATTEIYALSLHDALPILMDVELHPDAEELREVRAGRGSFDDDQPLRVRERERLQEDSAHDTERSEEHTSELSHANISYAVFCLYTHEAFSFEQSLLRYHS